MSTHNSDFGAESLSHYTLASELFTYNRHANALSLTFLVALEDGASVLDSVPITLATLPP